MYQVASAILDPSSKQQRRQESTFHHSDNIHFGPTGPAVGRHIPSSIEADCGNSDISDLSESDSFKAHRRRTSENSRKPQQSAMSDIALDQKVPVPSFSQRIDHATIQKSFPLSRRRSRARFEGGTTVESESVNNTTDNESNSASPSGVHQAQPSTPVLPQRVVREATRQAAAITIQSPRITRQEDIVRPYVFPVDEVAAEIQRNKDLLLRHMTLASTSGRLTLMNLSKRGLTADDAELVKEALMHNPSLAVLKLSYNELGDKGTAIISTGFIQDGQHHANLSILDLGFNDIGDPGCAHLALNAVAGNNRLKTLYLSGNRIKQKGAMSIAGAILQGCSLRDIHLSFNQIGAIGVQALARAIAEREAMKCAVATDLEGNLVQDLASSNPAIQTVEELHLGGTEMQQTGFLTLPSMILTNFSLRVLSLPNSSLSDDEMALLAQSFARNKKVPLEVLCLSHNEISDVGIEYLMNAVWGSTTLREMRFDNNNIRDRGAQLFAVVLTSINLEVIDLSCNNVTSVGMKALMKALSENNSLQQLGLCGITVDPTSAKALAYGIAYNSSLQYLYIDDCSVGYSAQRHVVAGVVSNRNASLRVLTGFPIGAIVVTLGLPKPLEGWSNDQVLGFVRMMWKMWRDQNGEVGEVGPAAPKIVVAASKRALAIVGVENAHALNTEPHERKLPHTSPLVQTNASLLERTLSGTLRVPPIVQGLKGAGRGSSSRLSEAWTEEGELDSKPAQALPLSSHRHDPVRRERNLKWLRSHFRSLHEIGRLPFNHADLWQLHQYFFSPLSATLPQESDEAEGSSEPVEEEEESNAVHDQPGATNEAETPSGLAMEIPKPPPDTVKAMSINAARELIEKIRAQRGQRIQSSPSTGDRLIARTSPEELGKAADSVGLDVKQPVHGAADVYVKRKPARVGGESEAGVMQRPLPLDAPQKARLGRKISYQMLGEAAIAQGTLERAIGAAATLSDQAVKAASLTLTRRRTLQMMGTDSYDEEEDDDDDSLTSSSSEEVEPATKRPRNFKPRIAFYPRIREKLEAYGSKPSQNETLALLRQLKFAENALFKGKDVYSDPEAIKDTEQATPTDVEMIILDLL